MFIDTDNLQWILLSEILERECTDNVQLQIARDFQIKADSELLHIAIHNLVSNAVKYSDGNPVVITIRQPELIIQDRGIGIPDADINRIFQPFYRASNIGSISGRGIGLALAKSIFERMGARITVSSQVDAGTTFKVIFSYTG